MEESESNLSEVRQVVSAEALSRDKWELMDIDAPSRQPVHANVHEALTEVGCTGKLYQQEALSSGRGGLLSEKHGNSLYLRFSHVWQLCDSQD
jgi:hypothetical protein